MRVALLCFLLGGCSVLDEIADSGPTPQNLNRIYLSGESVRVNRWQDLDRYTCIRGTMVCTAYGAKWECRCSKFELAAFR